MPWIRTEHGAVHIKMAAPRRRRCVGCRRLVLDFRLCDGRLKRVRKGRKTNTCNAVVCAACTHVPAPEKDLCPTHAAKWKSMREARDAAL